MKTYHYQISLDWDPGDEIWVATVPVLPGVSAHGDTQEEALREINVAIELYLEQELGMSASFVPPLPDIEALRKASKVLNKTEVARMMGIGQRTLNSRIKNGTPLKAGEAEKLRDELKKCAIVLV